MLPEDENLAAAVENRRCLTHPFAARVGFILPRMKQMRSFCHTPWMQSGKAQMSEVHPTEYSHRAADPEIRNGDREAGGSHLQVYSFAHKNEFSPIVSMGEPLRPGKPEVHQPRTRAERLKVFLPRVDYGRGTEICETLLLSRFPRSSYAAF
jgi:hypothetical protein